MIKPGIERESLEAEIDPDQVDEEIRVAKSIEDRDVWNTSQCYIFVLATTIKMYILK